MEQLNYTLYECFFCKEDVLRTNRNLYTVTCDECKQKLHKVSCAGCTKPLLRSSTVITHAYTQGQRSMCSKCKVRCCDYKFKGEAMQSTAGKSRWKYELAKTVAKQRRQKAETKLRKLLGVL